MNVTTNLAEPAARPVARRIGSFGAALSYEASMHLGRIASVQRCPRSTPQHSGAQRPSGSRVELSPDVTPYHA